MTSESQSSFKPALWLIAAIVSAVCMEFYVVNIWGAGQPSRFSDLYAPWWGSHELLLHGRNPYQPAVAHEIQSVIYGAPTPAGADDASEIAGGFAYPVYAALLLWPTVSLPFAFVQKIFACVAVLAISGSFLVWLRAVHFHGTPLRWLTLTVFAFGSFPVLQGLRLQNLSLIAAATLTLGVVLLSTERITLAGFFVAISTFKPQFTVVLVPWLAVWSISNWRQRQRFVWSFLVSMFLLLAASEWMQPGWVKDFLRVLRAYKKYTYGHSLLDVWFTPSAGPFVAAALLVGVFALCWSHRERASGSQGFLLVVSVMLAATVTVIPTLAPHTQLLLFPGLFCLYRYRVVLWHSNRLTRLALVALCLIGAWPWIAAAALTSATLLFRTQAALRWWELPLYTSPLLPLTVLLTLCCLIRIRNLPGETDLDSLLAMTRL